MQHLEAAYALEAAQLAAVEPPILIEHGPMKGVADL